MPGRSLRRRVPRHGKGPLGQRPLQLAPGSIPRQVRMIRPTTRGLFDRDAGRIGLFYAIVLPGLLAMIGLAGDGAGYIRTTQRADNIAAEAARAGGQAIRLPDAINGD